MKKISALILSLCLLIPSAHAELLDEIFQGIESFDPAVEETLDAPGEPLMELLSMDAETVQLDVSALCSFGITEAQLCSDERHTLLPVAGLFLAVADYAGFGTSRSMSVYYTKKTDRDGHACLLVAVVDLLGNRAYLAQWTPGSYQASGLAYPSFGEFMNEYIFELAEMSQVSSGRLASYFEELRNPENAIPALSVGAVSFELSEDGQSIFIDRPRITGGSGSFTIAYNIYDSDSAPVNYFYSDEERVAATPGYGGLFNVFVVVTDTVTGLSKTQNIGWQQLSWPPARQLTVGKVAFERSADGESIYLQRPSIACKGGSVTIAYNIYDAQGQPVNYFYSAQARVAASPGYTGRFNVFVVVTDTVTGETHTQDIGWQDINVDARPVYRALIVGMVNVPNAQQLPNSKFDVEKLAALLPQLNGGGYAGHIATGVDMGRQEVLSAIPAAFSGTKDNDTSFFFISTHGVVSVLTGTSAEDSEGALSCADGKMIKLKELASALSQSNPRNKVVVVIASCGSGAAVKNARQQQALFNRLVTSAFAAQDTGLTARGKRGDLRLNKFYVLTASDVYEDSYGLTGSRYNGSIISIALQDAVALSSGQMKADTNRDGQVSFNELFTYVYDFSYDLSSRGGSAPQHTQRWPENSEEVIFWR